MAVYSLTGYATSAFVFSGRTIQLDPTWSAADQYSYSVTDDDQTLSGDSVTNETSDDSSQQTADAFDETGSLIGSGEIYAENVYTLFGSDGSEIKLYFLEINGVQVGAVADGPIIPGVVYSYTQANVTPSNEPDYSSFADADYDPNAANTINGAENDDSLSGGAVGDSIDGGAGADTIDGGDGADTLLGGAGEDSLLGGIGNDTLIGGTGSDTIDGGDGNDVIYGDDGPTTSSTSEYLNWLAVGNDNADLSGGFVHDTGSMQVTFSFTDDGFAGTSSDPSGAEVDDDRTHYVESGEPFNPNSILKLSGTGGPGVTPTSTTTIDFAAQTGAGVSDEVENVSFRISDIDADAFVDIVTVNAYDALGNPVAVTITPVGSDTVSGNTITAAPGTNSPDEAEGSALFEIAGPVSRIEIIYENGGDTDQYVYVTDIHFDTIPTADGDQLSGGRGDDTIFGEAGGDTISGGEGSDSLDGGAGDDTITGDAGDDTLVGGAGADSLDGGTGNDQFTVSEGDTAIGGDGDDVFTLTDLGEPGNETITIIGGEGDETNGDTLFLTPDVQRSDITFTNTDDAAGGFSGFFTLPDGTLVNFSEIENIVCFTSGAKILTNEGERPVETLKIGDKVLTCDHGFQTIRWIGSRKVHADELTSNPKLRPVCIKSGALGEGLPQNDLFVSRQHRILVRSKIVQRMFDTDEVLVPAIKLTMLDNIFIDAQTEEVEYFHILFDQHEVIYAEGVPSESLFTGPEALKTIGHEARKEISMLFPEITKKDFAPKTARYFPPLKKQKKLIERHLKNQILPIAV